MTETSIKPAGHAVLIRRLKAKKTTDWGFVTRTSQHSDKMEAGGREIGEIVAVGPQAWIAHAVALLPLVQAKLVSHEVLEPWAKVGDLVFFARYSGKETLDPVSGEVFYLIHDEDVKSVLPEQSEWKVNILDPEVQDRAFAEERDES